MHFGNSAVTKKPNALLRIRNVNFILVATVTQCCGNLLSVEQQVAVTLWCSATPTEYRTIAHLFGIARSTVREIVHETCHCIVDVFMKDFPYADRLNCVVDEFKGKWGLPQCFGAVHGCHVPIYAAH